jgi:hypothetical protein
MDNVQKVIYSEIMLSGEQMLEELIWLAGNRYFRNRHIDTSTRALFPWIPTVRQLQNLAPRCASNKKVSVAVTGYDYIRK